MKEIRTRFAPSPTGFMHVGGIRTALFGWLLAQKHSGSFILRIEDTDKAREVEGSVEHVIESLDWLGLNRQEDPIVGGEYGPYKQSERLELYKKYAQQLIDSGNAYADPFTEEDVQAFREQAKANKKAFLFRDYRPDTTETPDDWYKKVSIRFKTTDVKRWTWQDAVRGELTAGEEALDDFVLIKADGYPTYNFAHVVDDYEMKISHVIRGEEFIPSTPKFLALHEALGFEVPTLVTVPPILNQNGGKKLSKRDGAKDVLEYRNAGYSSQAVLNFLASMGWNDGTEKEVFTPEELIDAFEVQRIQKSGAKFDETKLEWYEWQHAKNSIEEDSKAFLLSHGISEQGINEEFAQLALDKSRTVTDYLDQYGIYTTAPLFSIHSFDLAIIDTSLTPEIAEKYLHAAVASIQELAEPTQDQVEQALRGAMAELDASPRAFLNLIRWAISGKNVSPNLFAMITIIGIERSIERLENACT